MSLFVLQVQTRLKAFLGKTIATQYTGEGTLGLERNRHDPLNIYRIGDVLYNSMAYADDITVFSTNAKDLQRLIYMCTMYRDRWRFKYGIDKSKCMIIGKSPFTCEPVWRLNGVNVETIEILGNVFNSKGNNTSHVDNRLNKCRQSFYSLNSLGMSYPGAAPEVQAHLYKSIIMSASFNLRYGMHE